MTRSQRRAHLVIWIALGPALIGLIVAIAFRQTPAGVHGQAEREAARSEEGAQPREATE